MKKRKNIGSFAHTQKIYNTYPNDWTPETVEENQTRVITDLMAMFGIWNCNNINGPVNISHSVDMTLDGSVSLYIQYIQTQKEIYPNELI